VKGPSQASAVALEELGEGIRVKVRSDSIRFLIHDLIEVDVDTREFESMLSSVLSKAVRRHVDVSVEGTRVLAPVPRDLLLEVTSSVVSRLAGERGRNIHTGRRMIYISEPLGIPLVGHTAFGLIDRGTNVIQVRPISGCNINCIYCSVDEGRFSRTRWRDFVVDPEYLLKVFDEVAGFKGGGLEAHIDGQGEPALYPFLVDLVQGLSEHPNVKVVSMQTNALPLDERTVEELAEAGLDRLNVSVNSLDERKARAMAGSRDYDLEHVKGIVEYAAGSTEADVLVAPLWLPGFNDEDIVELIDWAVRVGCGQRWPALGIQNFLEYKFGRRPKFLRKVVDMKEFYAWLRKLERETGVEPLVLRPEHFGTEPRRPLPKPFRKGDVVEVDIVCEGRLRGEMIGVASGRAVAVADSANVLKPGDRAEVRVVRDKHNVFVAVPSSRG